MDQVRQDQHNSDPLNNEQDRSGLHDPSYQKGGAQGAEKGDGLNGDDGPDTGETRDVGRGAD